MRFSATFVGGAAMVSALTIPNSKLTLSLSDFGLFDTISLEEAEQGAANDQGEEKFASPAAVDEVTTAAVPGGPCANANQRVEWRNMNDGDKHSFVNAVKCLMDKPSAGNFPGATNRYEDLVTVHQSQNSDIHGNGLFLPWHRYYVWVFMRMLREECSYTAPFPWWDEVKDAGHFGEAPLFTSEFFGSLQESSNNEGVCVEDGVSTSFIQPPARNA